MELTEKKTNLMCDAVFIKNKCHASYDIYSFVFVFHSIILAFIKVFFVRKGYKMDFTGGSVRIRRK